MPDKATEFLEQMIDQRLKDIADELKNIAIMLEGYKSAAERDVQLSTRLMASVRNTQSAVGVPRYLSGRWPLKDGDIRRNGAQPTNLPSPSPSRWQRYDRASTIYFRALEIDTKELGRARVEPWPSTSDHRW